MLIVVLFTAWIEIDSRPEWYDIRLAWKVIWFLWKETYPYGDSLSILFENASFTKAILNNNNNSFKTLVRYISYWTN